MSSFSVIKLVCINSQELDALVTYCKAKSYNRFLQRTNILFSTVHLSEHPPTTVKNGIHIIFPSDRPASVLQIFRGPRRVDQSIVFLEAYRLKERQRTKVQMLENRLLLLLQKLMLPHITPTNIFN